MYLDSITSKYCATITYCYTLFRPAFCPFCLGNDSLSAPARWTSWVRDAQLQAHIKNHLENARWPLPCPHPLCTFSVNDEPSFLYHLQNAHSLRMTKQQKNVVAGLPQLESINRKRKTPDPADQDHGFSKRSKNCLTRSRSDTSSVEASEGYLPQKSPRSVCEVHEASDIPELTYSEVTSPPDPDEISDTLALCSLNLRSLSPSIKNISCSGNEFASEQVPRTIALKDLLLIAESPPPSIGSDNRDLTKPTKPHIINRGPKPPINSMSKSKSKSESKPKPKLKYKNPPKPKSTPTPKPDLKPKPKILLKLGPPK